jgi:Tfp pilus assembly protein PilF
MVGMTAKLAPFPGQHADRLPPSDTLRQIGGRLILFLLLVVISGCASSGASQALSFSNKKAKQQAEKAAEKLAEAKSSKAAAPKEKKNSPLNLVKPFSKEIAPDATAIAALLSEAAEFERQGDFDKATDSYQRVLAQSGSHAEAHHRLAVLADRRQDFETAEKHYQAALKTKSRDAALLSDLGYSYFLRGDQRQSEEFLNKSLAVDPQYRMALLNLGMVYGQQGRKDEALAVFRQAGNEQEALRNLAMATQETMDGGLAAAKQNLPDWEQGNQQPEISADELKKMTLADVRERMDQMKKKGVAKRDNRFDSPEQVAQQAASYREWIERETAAEQARLNQPVYAPDPRGAGNMAQAGSGVPVAAQGNPFDSQHPMSPANNSYQAARNDGRPKGTEAVPLLGDANARLANASRGNTSRAIQTAGVAGQQPQNWRDLGPQHAVGTSNDPAWANDGGNWPAPNQFGADPRAGAGGYQATQPVDNWGQNANGYQAEQSAQQISQNPRGRQNFDPSAGGPSAASSYAAQEMGWGADGGNAAQLAAQLGMSAGPGGMFPMMAGPSQQTARGNTAADYQYSDNSDGSGRTRAPTMTGAEFASPPEYNQPVMQTNWPDAAPSYRTPAMNPQNMPQGQASYPTGQPRPQGMPPANNARSPQSMSRPGTMQQGNGDSFQNGAGNYSGNGGQPQNWPASPAANFGADNGMMTSPQDWAVNSGGSPADIPWSNENPAGPAGNMGRSAGNMPQIVPGPAMGSGSGNFGPQNSPLGNRDAAFGPNGNNGASSTPMWPGRPTESASPKSSGDSLPRWPYAP